MKQGLRTARRPRASARRIGAAAGLTLALALLAAPTPAAVGPAPLPPTLAAHLQAEGFTSADLAAIAAGRAVARGLPRAERDEAGAIGVVRIDLSPDAFAARVRDIVRFEQGSGVSAVGRLGLPATAADLDGFVLPAGDADAIAGCELEDCDINLSAAAIERLHAVDQRAPGGRARLTQVARQSLADYVADYQRRGNEALVVYRDRAPAIALRESSGRLLRQSSELHRTVPAVRDFFDRYPAQPLPAGAEQFFYWSVMSFGMKPITRVNHVVLAPHDTDGLGGYVVVSRTLYASHYFRDGLEVKWLVPVSAARAAFYLVSVNRSHSESLLGLKGLLLGGKIRSSARSGVERHVIYVKTEAERGAAK
jgi:hypothetical protein